jgi:hypothetical protein
VGGGCCFLLTIFLFFFFFAVVALALFFLFVILLPTLGQQGTLVDNPLMSLSPDTVPAFDDIASESPDDFLPPSHNSSKDCKVLEALYNSPLDRKRIRGSFESCMYTCPRVQINFRALMQGTPPQEIGLTMMTGCEYITKSSRTPSGPRTSTQSVSPGFAPFANRLTPIVNVAKQKASELCVKFSKQKKNRET